MVNNVVPLATAKAKMSEYINNIKNGLDHVIITQNGIPVIAMIDIDELYSLYETIDVLSDKETMENLKKSKEEYEKGKYTTLEDLEKELNIKNNG